MSLKHRNTSKWAKNIIAKGINDVQVNDILRLFLYHTFELTGKVEILLCGYLRANLSFEQPAFGIVISRM